MLLTTSKLETAIATLKKSIEDRRSLLTRIKFINHESRLALNKTHLKELAELEILELKLRGRKNGFTN